MLREGKVGSHEGQLDLFCLCIQMDGEEFRKTGRLAPFIKKDMVCIRWEDFKLDKQLEAPKRNKLYFK